MKLKKFLCVLLACAGALGGLSMPAKTAESPCQNVVWMDDLECDWIDPAEVEAWEYGPVPLATNSIDVTFSGRSIKAVGYPISLTANDMVEFTCSYSPSFANVDAGVIAPDGKFYFINGEEGSINKIIKVSQTGSYSVAIRNNSSQTVRVVGFVNY